MYIWLPDFLLSIGATALAVGLLMAIGIPTAFIVFIAGGVLVAMGVITALD